MKNIKIINLIEVLVLLAISLTAFILFIYYGPLNTNSFLLLDILILVINPLVHLLFLAIKLKANQKYNSVLYTETFCTFTLVYGVGLYYIALYANGYTNFFYLYNLALLLPFCFIPLVIHLGNKKLEKIKENAIKTKKANIRK